MEITKPRGRPLGTGAQKSDAVKHIRTKLGLTQMELAVKIGCSLSAVQRMERNETLPSHGALKNNLARLAEQASISMEKEVTA